MEGAGLFLDYSKNRITAQTLQLLFKLAEESGLRAASTPCFAATKSISRKIGGCCTSPCARRGGLQLLLTKNTWSPDVHAVFDKMAVFADRIRSGAWKGHTGKPIRNVINIGIGGSDLGRDGL